MSITLTPPPVAFPAESTSRPVVYRPVVVRTLGEFEQLAPRWDAFMQAAQVENLCMTHAWLLAWLKHFTPDELQVLIVTDEDDRWLGVAPLKISRSTTGLCHRLLRHVQFIGTHPTVFDWMKIAILPGVDEEFVLQAMAEALQQARWDVLDLQFASDHGQLELLCQALEQPFTAIGEDMPIPYLPLPATEAEYEPTRRKKTRLEVNRHRNRFAKEFEEPLQLNFCPDGQATRDMLNRFCEGHIQYWAEKGSKSDFQRFPRLRAFYQDMLLQADTTTQPHQPRLMFSVLQLGEHQLSYHLGFWQGGGYLCHITNFNQDFRSYSPGTIHMDALIFETLHRQGREFEFGRGDEPYKNMWAKGKKPLWSLCCFRHPLSRGLWQVDIALKALLRKLKP